MDIDFDSILEIHQGEICTLAKTSPILERLCERKLWFERMLRQFVQNNLSDAIRIKLCKERREEIAKSLHPIWKSQILEIKARNSIDKNALDIRKVAKKSIKKRKHHRENWVRSVVRQCVQEGIFGNVNKKLSDAITEQTSYVSKILSDIWQSSKVASEEELQKNRDIMRRLK